LLRDQLTKAAVGRALELSKAPERNALYRMLTVEALVNAMVALLATGGSTNHTIHLVAVARQAGILIDWDDFSRLSAIVPLLARVYPNGEADVNQFHQAGGTGWVMRELRSLGLLCENVRTIVGEGLDAYCQVPVQNEKGLQWQPVSTENHAPDVIASAAAPFSPEGGLKLLTGNLGRAIIKVSAVKPEHRRIVAPARVFTDQSEVKEAFGRGELNRDLVVVVRGQGPRANGMPELHQLTPILGALQDRGHAVALVTDGRMSGASGKVPAAIHVTPEAVDAGMIASVRDGDTIELDAETGRLQVHWRADHSGVATPLAAIHVPVAGAQDPLSLGRGLFARQRGQMGSAEAGASFLGLPYDFADQHAE
jgi:phosphogluconate dehydratase